MGNKKMGRPTDNPKDTSLKVYFDKDTSDKLEDCVKALEVSKSEIVRRGIRKVHDDLNKK